MPTEHQSTKARPDEAGSGDNGHIDALQKQIRHLRAAMFFLAAFSLFLLIRSGRPDILRAKALLLENKNGTVAGSLFVTGDGMPILEFSPAGPLGPRLAELTPLGLTFSFPSGERAVSLHSAVGKSYLELKDEKTKSKAYIAAGQFGSAINLYKPTGETGVWFSVSEQTNGGAFGEGNTTPIWELGN